MANRTRYLTHAALIAAAYAALCWLQNILLPGSASWAVQFRVAEALCVLAFFTPAAIAGLSAGCLLFNLSFSAALPLDPLVGSLATLLCAVGMYRLRRWPWLGLWLPAVCNGLLVGWELALYMGGGFWVNGGYVFLSEAAVLLTLGSLLYLTLKSRKLSRFF